MSKINVILPVYNVEKYLPKCLDSLVNQTFKDFEILIVNDGSSDDSQKIINEYVKKYPNIIKSYEKENGGQASARNLALKESNGEYITFVDSDDWVDKTYLEKMYNKVVDNGADIVVCGAYISENDVNKKLETFKMDSSDMKKNYILSCSGPCWQLIKKELIVQNNLYFLENHFYEDIAVIPALGMFANKICYLDEPLYYYLVRPGSTMNQLKYSKSLEDIFDSLENLKQLFIQNNCFEKYKSELEYLYIEHLLHAASLRFLPYKEGTKNIEKIINIMQKTFPNWKSNKYYKTESIKYKIICNLLYKNKIKTVKKILKK